MYRAALTAFSECSWPRKASRRMYSDSRMVSPCNSPTQWPSDCCRESKAAQAPERAAATSAWIGAEGEAILAAVTGIPSLAEEARFSLAHGQRTLAGLPGRRQGRLDRPR